jgi:hypothetical protein
MVLLMVFLTVFGSPNGRPKMDGGPVNVAFFVDARLFYDCLNGD